MRGWILAVAGLLALAAGAYTLHAPHRGTDQIDAASRAQLERVLQEAE